MAKIETDDRARQGPPGRSVLYVLIGSLVLVAIAMVGVMTWNSAKTPDTPPQASQAQSSGPGPATGTVGPGSAGSQSPSVNPNPPK